jgi:tyrosine-protein phosphatase SIW14
MVQMQPLVQMQPRLIALVGVLSVATVFFGAQPAKCRSVDQAAHKLEGLPSWGRVTDVLYRGGQPALAGFRSLQKMGVAIIVNFRDEPPEITAEQREVESLGIKYVSIPWSGRNEPSNAQVVQFLDLIRANPQAKVFVHCKRGADRTGVMIAVYRIAVEHKTVAEAVSEMDQFNYDHFWLPQLERYVRSLPELLLSNPVFNAYVSMPSSPSPVARGAAVAAVASPTLVQ